MYVLIYVGCELFVVEGSVCAMCCLCLLNVMCCLMCDVCDVGCSLFVSNYVLFNV